MTELIQDILEDLRDVVKTAPTNEPEILRKLSASLESVRDTQIIKGVIDTPVPNKNR